MNITEAKKSFCALVARAQSGEETVVEKQGAPAARLVPARSRAQQATEEWRLRRRRILLNPKGTAPLTLAGLYQEGRR
jgi:prevent-host-death family protein